MSSYYSVSNRAINDKFSSYYEEDPSGFPQQFILPVKDALITVAVYDNWRLMCWRILRGKWNSNSVQLLNYLLHFIERKMFSTNMWRELT